MYSCVYYHHRSLSVGFVVEQTAEQIRRLLVLLVQMGGVFDEGL